MVVCTRAPIPAQRLKGRVLTHCYCVELSNCAVLYVEELVGLLDLARNPAQRLMGQCFAHCYSIESDSCAESSVEELAVLLCDGPTFWLTT